MAESKQDSKRVVEYLLTKVPVTSKEDTVGHVLNLIRKQKNWDTINYVYVLDNVKKLIGVVTIKELMQAKDTAVIKNLMIKNPAGVTASSVQEKAAMVAIHYNIKAVPVFKPGTREFLGTVGTDKILAILHNEHVEDFLKFSGIVKDHKTIDIFKTKPSRLFRLRLPWLLAGLVGGIIGVYIVGQFETVLREVIALSFFIPVVIYISNAIAIQSQAILIRRLASKQVKEGSFLRRELYVSLFLALTSALVIAGFAGFWLKSVVVAFIVGSSIVVSTLAAVTVAIIIPLILYKAKKDPALGSGPFATSIQDIITLLIYFLIATVILF